jgi:hypothetical protein
VRQTMADGIDITDGGVSSALDDTTGENEEHLTQSEEPVRNDSVTRERARSARRTNRPPGWEQPGTLNCLPRVQFDHMDADC